MPSRLGWCRGWAEQPRPRLGCPPGCSSRVTARHCVTLWPASEAFATPASLRYIASRMPRLWDASACQQVQWIPRSQNTRADALAARATASQCDHVWWNDSALLAWCKHMAMGQDCGIYGTFDGSHRDSCGGAGFALELLCPAGEHYTVCEASLCVGPCAQESWEAESIAITKMLACLCSAMAAFHGIRQQLAQCPRSFCAW